MSEGIQEGGGFKLRFANAFVPITKRMFDDEGDFINDKNKKLSKIGSHEDAQTFVSRCVGYGFAVGGVLWLLATLITILLFTFVFGEPENIIGVRLESDTLMEIIRTLRLPLLIIVTGVIFGTIGFVIGFVSPLINLNMQINGREREINMLLPDTVDYMYALSVGGMNQLDVLDAVADAGDTYGEVSKEFQFIINEMDYFGVDYRTAINNRASNTPSEEFEMFLTDMISILSSGGDLQKFLAEQKEKFNEKSAQQQEDELDTLEVFGEMYMTLSLFPVLLIILLVIMMMTGDGDTMLLQAVVYVLTPMIGFGFIIMISTVKQDDPGTGYLDYDGDDDDVKVDDPLSLGPITEYEGEFNIFDQIRSKEGKKRVIEIAKAPKWFFKSYPEYTFIITLPVSLFLIGYSFMTGIGPQSGSEFGSQAIWGSIIYIFLPLYISAVPYAVFYELQQSERRGITSNLTDELRKLASSNDTGQTLLQSMKTTANSSSGQLAKEFMIIYNKVQYGVGMKRALIQMNNKYHMPRLARTIKLIANAQETSNDITPVLRTAANASSRQDNIEQQRKSRTRMQLAIIIMSFAVMVGVMAILQVMFLGEMAALSDDAGDAADAGDFDLDMDVDMLSMYFLHALTLQGITAGLICGYLRTSQLRDGVKWIVALPTFALLVWIVIA